jgi:serine/threonine protein kinase/predicted Zn-dependent protease
MEHPKEQELRDYLNEQLEEFDNQKVASHLESCKSCCATLESIVDATSLFPKGLTPNQQSSAPSALPIAGEQSIEDVHFGLGHRFLVFGEIARGGMGVVYRGFDRELKREVAIKVLQKDQDVASHRFYREAQILGQLQHPGIVPIYETGQLKDGRMYIAMKLVIGQTLQELVEHGDGSKQLVDLLGIIGQICETIAYAHSRNIVHRDLKPENVMVGNFGEVQVMDWGLAKKLEDNDAADLRDSNFPANKLEINYGSQKRNDDGPANKIGGSQETNGNFESHQDTKKPTNTLPLNRLSADGLSENEANPSSDPSKDASPLSPLATQPGAVFGTPAYMAPEQAHGHQTDQRADVFSLGGMLLFLLTGKAPFDAPTKTAALSKSRTHDLAEALLNLKQKNLDRELVSIVESCLAEKVEERPNDAGEVNERFKDYLANREKSFEETRLEKARTAEKLIAQAKRNRMVIGFSTSIVIAMLVSALAGYLYLTEKNARVENEARVEREHFDQRVRHENEIRVNLASARVYESQAPQRLPHKQHTDWTLAKMEIEKATPLVNDSIDDELQSEFRKLKQIVGIGHANSIHRRDQHQLEAECCEELFKLAEISQYPEDMDLCKSVDLLPLFQNQFQRLGIEPGLVSHQAVERLKYSEFRSELFYGLLMWRREINLRLGEPIKMQAVQQLRKTYFWIEDLIDAADTDPFRRKIRDHIGAARFQQVIEMASQEQAVSSPLTVHTIALAMATFEIHRDERVDFLLRAHRKFPNDFFVNWYMATFAGGWSNAKEFALACYSLRSDNPAVLSKLGRSYLEEGQYDRAIETLEQLVEFAPWYQAGQYYLAQAYQFRGDLELAKEQYAVSDRVLEEVQDSFLNRIEYLRENQQHEHADDMEKQLSDFRSPSMENLSSRKDSPVPMSPAEIAEQEQLTKQVDERLEQLAESPADSKLYKQLVKDYLTLVGFLKRNNRTEVLNQTVDKAIEDFNAVAELAPKTVAPYKYLAELCQEVDRQPAAIEALQKAIAIEPTHPSLHQRLESLYRRLCTTHLRTRDQTLLNRTIDEAIETMTTYSQDSPPDFTGAHTALAQFCEYFKEYETAIVAAERAIKAEPDNRAHRLMLGSLYMTLGRRHEVAGRTQKANEAFEKAIDANQEWVAKKPKSWLAHEQLSIAFKHRGKLADAMKRQKKVLEIKPTYPPGRYRYAMLAVALAGEQNEQGDRATAIKTLDDSIDFLKAIHQDGFLMDLFDRLATLQYEAGNLKKTIYLLRNVELNRPGDHLVRGRLAQAYADAGQFEKAESILLELRTSSPRSVPLIQMLAELYHSQDKSSDAESLIHNVRKAGVNSEAFENVLSRISDSPAMKTN